MKKTTTFMMGALFLTTAACTETPDPVPAPRTAQSTKATEFGVRIGTEITQVCGIESPKTFFGYDSATLSTDASKQFDDLAKCLSKGGALDSRNVRVVGYADPRGQDEYNKMLGMTRAESVQKMLTQKGVSNDKIIVKSQGEELAIGTDTDGYSFDRRVEIRLAD